MSFLKIHSFDMRRVLFSQLKVGETYYEYYTDSRDKFVGFNGYCAIFKQNVFFAYKKCKFYEVVPFKEIVRMNQINQIKDEIDDDLAHIGNDTLFFE
jgi:hypothetical protein